MTAQPEWTFDDLLDSRPTPNESVRAGESSVHGLVLRVPLRKRWYMRPPVSWVLPVRDHRSLALDAIGREVWEMCDGRTTTEAIIERFSLRHYVSFHEARLSVTQYMQVLTRHGLIAMVGLPASEARP